jgi:uncharacterized membrane protein
VKGPRAPALLLGVGLGGFIDGILLHQVLQWHHMLTSTSGHPMTTVAGLEANTLADGLFHLATWICVTAGSALLYTAWRDGRLAPPRRAQLGLLLTGWGLFNLLEGLIDHSCSAFTTYATTSTARSDGTSPSSPSAPASLSPDRRSSRAAETRGTSGVGRPDHDVEVQFVEQSGGEILRARRLVTLPAVYSGALLVAPVLREFLPERPGS